jgi:hypothetical protein
MIRLLRRTLLAALVGGLSAVACLAVAYTLRADVSFDVARQAPVGRGFYDVERDGRQFYAWTSGRAEVTLPDLDRRAAWACSVAFNGARPTSDLPQPDLQIAIDGVTVAVRRATNEFQRIEVVAPRRPHASGLTLTLTSSPTFVPGGSDTRVLGVVLDDLNCRPVSGAFLWPPRRATIGAALGGTAFGAALGIAGIAAAGGTAAAALVAAAQSVPLAAGAAPYSAYPRTAVWIACWVAALMALTIRTFEWRLRRRLTTAARFVVTLSAGACYVKLLGLLSPSKPLVDALFHAHRLESVLSGRYYFTQLSTSGTPFPYAIGLYLFAAPWSVLTSDHVALLRIIVCATDTIAGALLYVMIVRTWHDRLAGAIASALYCLVPLTYAIVGNANLTNAFGQSVSVVTMVAVAVFASGRGHLGQFVGLVLLATLGLLSHVSTFALLLATLIATSVLIRTAGGPELRATARSVILVTLLAVVCSVAVYYGHFWDVYKPQIARMGSPAAVVTAPAAPAGPATKAEPGIGIPAPAPGQRVVPVWNRVAAFGQTASNTGWPILILGLVGAWRVFADRARDRLVLVVAAWACTFLAFAVVSILMPVDARYYQDTWEFVGRVEHATCPAAVVLAARGAVWGLRRPMLLRSASVALLLWAAIIGVRAWIGWFA